VRPPRACRWAKTLPAPGVRPGLASLCATPPGQLSNMLCRQRVRLLRGVSSFHAIVKLLMGWALVFSCSLSLPSSQHRPTVMIEERDSSIDMNDLQWSAVNSLESSPPSSATARVGGMSCLPRPRHLTIARTHGRGPPTAPLPPRPFQHFPPYIAPPFPWGLSAILAHSRSALRRTRAHPDCCC